MNAKEVNRYVGSKIRKAREHRGLSLRDLAEQVKGKRGYSIMSLSSMERGVTPIEVADLELLSQVLEYPLSYFMPDTAVLQATGLAQDEEALIEALRRVPPAIRTKMLKAVFAMFGTQSDIGS